MWVVPSLDFRHLLPRASFYPEWDAFALGLAALLPLLSPQSWRKQELPAVALLPAGLILLVLWQLQLGLIPYAGHALTVALYLLWTILLILLGKHLREIFGLPLLATILAAFLLTGSELQALSAILQNFRWDTPLNHLVLWTHADRVIVNGNLGQANALSDYLALGLVSLGLLYARASLSGGLTTLLATPLLYGMVLSGSRSGWLYLAAFAAASYVWQRRDEALRPLFRYAWRLLPAFLLVHGVAQLPWLAGAVGASPLEKMSNLGGYTQRLYLWHEAALVFAQSPWLGAGFGQFGWQHFLHSAELHNPIPDVMGSHAHNLILQLAAETGLAGVALLLLVAALWYHGQRQPGRTAHPVGSDHPVSGKTGYTHPVLTPDRAWGYSLLLILGIHSLLEYPLWYAYFLGIAAFTLGMLENHHLRFDLSRLGAPLMALILLGGGWELKQLYIANGALVGLAQPKIEGHPEEYEQRVEAAMKVMDADLLMRPYADLYMASSAPFGINDPAVRLRYSEPALRLAPVDTLGYRVAVLLAVQGRMDEAKIMMERAIWAHPARFEVVRNALPLLIFEDPEHLVPLRDFAVARYAERQRLISNQ